jgi:heme-degrading monooxygenase HmoA
MYTVIRRYTGVKDTNEVVRRATGEFGPMLAERAGFIGYWVVDGGAGTVASITVFESKEQADESTAAAAGWVKENLAGLIAGAPEVTVGETTGVPAPAAA